MISMIQKIMNECCFLLLWLSFNGVVDIVLLSRGLKVAGIRQTTWSTMSRLNLHHSQRPLHHLT